MIKCRKSQFHMQFYYFLLLLVINIKLNVNKISKKNKKRNDDNNNSGLRVNEVYQTRNIDFIFCQRAAEKKSKTK